jgi:hypothetical protein
MDVIGPSINLEKKINGLISAAAEIAVAIRYGLEVHPVERIDGMVRRSGDIFRRSKWMSCQTRDRWNHADLDLVLIFQIPKKS